LTRVAALARVSGHSPAPSPVGARMNDRIQSGTPGEDLLLSPLTLDRFVDEGIVLPGGGAINIAWHRARAGSPARVMSRVGEGDRRLFASFLDSDPGSLVAPGLSASIDISIADDRQPKMGNYVEGVWSDLRLTPDEEATVAGAATLHSVLVPAVTREIHRLGDAGRLDGVAVSGDFLDYRYCDERRFAETVRFLDVGFVGWPGGLGDAEVAGMRRVAFGLRRLVVVTFGALGALAFDGESGRRSFFPAEAVAVTGTTIGCGDAFIAAFLAARRRRAGLEAAMRAGTLAGAEATAWRRALPDEAYAER